MALLGGLFIGLGFYALAAALLEWQAGMAFSFHAIDTTFADVFGTWYMHNASAALRALLTEWPTFFVLVPLGVVALWWGTRPPKPKPKFRKS